MGKENIVITGFVCGAFDLVHTGHCLLFESCKKNCDYLIVGLHIDPSLEREEKNKPIQSVFERWVQLDQNRHIDLIIPYSYEEELKQILLNYDIDVRFLGSDYSDNQKEITGEGIVEIQRIDRNHSYSSSELRKRIKNLENKNYNPDLKITMNTTKTNKYGDQLTMFDFYE